MSKQLSAHSSAKNNVSAVTLAFSNQVMLREYPNLIQELMEAAAENALEVTLRVVEVAQKCLLQLDFWLNRSTWGHEVDGQKWLRLGLRQLQEAALRFISISTLSRAMNLLEALGLIKVENLNRHKYDQTRWYTLNAEGLKKLTSLKVIMVEEQAGREIAERFNELPKIEEMTAAPPPNLAEDAAMRQAFAQAMAELCETDYRINGNRNRIDKIVGELVEQGYIREDLIWFERWWKYHCWINKRGKPYEAPALGNITQYINKVVRMGEREGWNYSRDW